ncbi:MAG: DUF1961 family protein [Planctomycetes bacterium]|nr:DUF1961 family protein [Planctomycetota bacterium]
MDVKFSDRTLTGKIVYQTDFSDLDKWWWEGVEDVWAENGHLFIKTTLERTESDRDWVSSVFLNQVFKGNLMVEFWAQSFSPESHRNFNLFVHTMLRDGRDLYETRAERTGDYGEYHVMDNYLFTCLPSSELQEQRPDPKAPPMFRYRMRRDPGFFIMKEAHGYVCENFRWYKFQFLVRNGEISVCVDDLPHETYTWFDENPLTEGYIGLRSFMSHLEYRDLAVYEVD